MDKEEDDDGIFGICLDGCSNCCGNKTELADIVDVEGGFDIQLGEVALKIGACVLGIDIMAGIVCVLLVLGTETKADVAIDKFKVCDSPKTRSPLIKHHLYLCDENLFAYIAWALGV